MAGLPTRPRPGSALKWAAVALGLTDYNESSDLRWNVKAYVNSLSTPAIIAAQATTDADPNAAERIRLRQEQMRKDREAVPPTTGGDDSDLDDDDYAPSSDGRRTRPRRTAVTAGEATLAAMAAADV